MILKEEKIPTHRLSVRVASFQFLGNKNTKQHYKVLTLRLTLTNENVTKNLKRLSQFSLF